MIATTSLLKVGQRVKILRGIPSMRVESGDFVRVRRIGDGFDYPVYVAPDGVVNRSFGVTLDEIAEVK